MNYSDASIYCEEEYDMESNIKGGYFICPECGEPIYEEDWKHRNWDFCPNCGFEFMED